MDRLSAASFALAVAALTGAAGCGSCEQKAPPPVAVKPSSLHELGSALRPYAVLRFPDGGPRAASQAAADAAAPP